MPNLRPRSRTEHGRFPGRPDLALPIVFAGIVEHGDGRGRELGYPTANVAVEHPVVPPEGVFAGTVARADGSIHRAAISIGRRETFYRGIVPSLVEAYLLDFSDDLYDESVEVVLDQELRPQTRFTSIEALIDQIARDVDHCRVVIDDTVLEARWVRSGARLR